MLNPVKQLMQSGYSGMSQHQKAEAELLEIILAAPNWMNEIANRVHPQELQNPHFQQLYQICCDLHERGDGVSRNQLLNELEDADLKQMVVVLEDWSHDRNIRAKLDDRVNNADIPHYLIQATQVLAWRREESEHDRTRGEIAGYTSAEDQLTDTDQKLLIRSMEFHKKRIQNKTTT
jgi:replicative DNA helicase